MKHKFIGVFTTEHKKWCEIHDKFELVSPKAKKKDCDCKCHTAWGLYHGCSECNYFNGKHWTDEVEVTKKSTDYRLKLGKYKIFATVSDKGITLTTMDDHDKFWFCNSTPEMIKNMASLMLEASKLK